jgi:hypothetical protein
MLRKEVSLRLDGLAGNTRILIIRHPEKPGESWPVKRIVGGHWGPCAAGAAQAIAFLRRHLDAVGCRGENRRN